MPEACHFDDPSWRQETVTVAARIPRGAMEATRAALRPHETPFARGSLFADPALGIHFARLVLVEADPTDDGSPAWLMMESNFDTTRAEGHEAIREHFAELARCRLAALRQVFELCDGFNATMTPSELANAWFERVVPHTARYQGHTARTLPRIRFEARLADALRRLVGRLPPGTNAQAAWQAVRGQVLADSKLTAADREALQGDAPAFPEPVAYRERLSRTLRSAYLRSSGLQLLRLFPHLPAILLNEEFDMGFDPVAYLRKRTGPGGAAFRAYEAAKAASEDWAMQNALTHLVPLRDGAARAPIVKRAHAVLAAATSRHFDFIGELGAIPTIHFGKWMLFDDDRRLLFFSSYDGNWESYIGDFVDQATAGLNIAWFCAEGYPKTRFVVKGGAADEETFKTWTRAYEQPTQVFYTAYPDLSVTVVNNNSWIRRGFHHPEEVEAWIRRLG